MSILTNLRNKATPWLGRALSKLTGATTALTRRHIPMSTRPEQYFKLLPYMDPCGVVTEADRKNFRLMLKDSVVRPAFLSKVLAVASLDLSVSPEDADNEHDNWCAEFCKYSTLRMNGGIVGLVEAILPPLLVDGYVLAAKERQPLERGKYAGQWTITNLEPKHPDLYEVVVNQYGKPIKVVGRGPARGDTYDDMSDFVFATFLPMYGNPTGTSDMQAAYTAYWRLDTIKKLRHSRLRNLSNGVFMVGKYGQTVSQATLVDAIKAGCAGGFAVVPDDVVIESLNIAGGSNSEFQTAVQDLTNEIILCITGAILQMTQGSTGSGSYAQSKVHQGGADLFVWHLADVFARILNQQVFPDLCDLNRVGFSDYPRASFGGVSDEALAPAMVIDEGLARLGLGLSKKETYQRYRRSQPTDADDTVYAPKPEAGAGFGPMPGDELPGSPDVTAGVPAARSALLDSVGGSANLTALQQQYAAGEIDRASALAAATIVYGLDAGTADKLFPQSSAGVAAKPDETSKAETGGAAGSAVPFAESGDNVAVTGKPGREAEKLLAASQSAGIKTLADICETAFARTKPGDTTLFTDDERQRLADALAATTATAHLLGQKRLRDQLAKRGKKPVAKFADPAPIRPLPPVKALEYFRNLVPGISGDPMLFGQTMQRQAFTLAVTTEETLLTAVQDAIAKTLETGAGGTYDVYKLMESAGVLPANPQYSEMVMRTNALDSYTRGYETERTDPDVVEMFPVWRYDTVGDSRVGDDHSPMDGKYYPASASFAEVRGKRVYNCRCVLPGQFVSGRILAASKAWYSGQAVEIVTRSGVRLSVTVNHPILSGDGFAAAGTIRKGDNLVTHDAKIHRLVSGHDVENTPALIEDVFRSLPEGNAKRVSKRWSAFDFHGDGESVDSEIEIKAVDGELLLEWDNAISERRSQGDFGSGRIHPSIVSSGSTFTSARTHPGGHRYTTEHDAATQEPERDGIAAYRKTLGKFVDASPSSIQFANVGGQLAANRAIKTASDYDASRLHMPAKGAFNNSCDRSKPLNPFTVTVASHDSIEVWDGRSRGQLDGLFLAPDDDAVFNQVAANGFTGSAELESDLANSLASQIPVTDAAQVGYTLPPFEFYCLGSAADLDASLTELSSQDAVTGPNFVGKYAERYPGSVSLDEVIDVRQFEYTGHVYDLGTDVGYYAVGNTDQRMSIIHNCVPTAIYMDDWEELKRQGARVETRW